MEGKKGVIERVKGKGMKGKKGVIERVDREEKGS